MTTSIQELIELFNADKDATLHSGRISEHILQHYLIKEAEVAEVYAEFCIMSDREGKPIIKFLDFIKLINEE